ncbi:MAG: hypothetical protein FWC94_01475 [Bacteroidales bacterium]|nr:hypothetical protein [Bacteroidales bacterium]
MKKSLILIMLVFAVLTLPAQVIRVSPTGSGDNSGSDWGNTAPLQVAVPSASNGTVLWVLEGIYNLDSTLVIPQGVRVYGGFSGTETDVSQRNFALNTTILDAGKNFAVVTLSENSLLSGFTIQNGIANIPTRMYGGGVLMLAGSRLEYSYIINNTAARRGGGIFVVDDAEIFSSVIANNKAAVSGFAVSGDQVTFLNNTVVGNEFLDCSSYTLEMNRDTICTGDSILLIADVSLAGTAFVWSTGATTPSINTGALTARDTFSVKITTPSHCVVEEFFDIYILAQTLTRTSAEGTDFQSVGVDSAITQIVYAFGGLADSVRVTWTGTADTNTPPAGIDVMQVLASNIVIISGAPTQVGIFTYTVTTIGKRCDSVYLTGTIMAGMRGCNLNEPGWGDAGLGTIGWGTTSNTDIETGTTLIPGTDNRPAQMWSGAVFAEACQKTAYNGGVDGNFNADCRQAQSVNNGHFFSWCAVVRFENDLCPFPWRVPSREDFMNLDIALGGTGANRSSTSPDIGGLTMSQQISVWYIGPSGTATSPQIGGIWRGSRPTGYSGNPSTTWSFYWSSTPVNADPIRAHSLRLGSTVLEPQGINFKANGFAVRCVRDIEFCQDSIGGMQRDTICEGTNITLNARPGANHLWSNGATTQSITLNNVSADTILTVTITTAEFCMFVDTFAITVLTQEDCAILAVNCNLDPLGFELGIPGFASTRTWVVNGRNGGPTQEWSDAVITSGCDTRTTFDGGTSPGFNADCRNSVGAPNFTAHYFTWCMVVRFADTLCPYPWRVPSAADFRQLHTNLTGEIPSYPVHWILLPPNTYTGTANTPNGGIWGGARWTGRGANPGADNSWYWTSTEFDAAHANDLTYTWASNLWVPNANAKSEAFGLRCVRTITADTLANCNPLSLTGGSEVQSICGSDPITTITYNATGVESVAISWFIATPTDTTQIAQPEGLTFDPTTLTISGSITDAVPGTVFLYKIYARTATTCLTARGTITIFAAVTPGVISSAGGITLNICSGDTPVEFTNATSASGGNPASTSYQWQMSTDSITWDDILFANNPTFQAGTLTDTTWFRRMHLNACGDTASNVITVNVHALPPTPTTDSIRPNTDCSDMNPNGIIFITAVPGVTYSIDSITWGTDSTFTGLSQGDRRIFIRNINGCVSYATVHVGTADGMPDLDSILVTPSATICNPFGSGSIVIAPAITNLDATATFQWSSSTDGGTTFNNITTGGTSQNLTLTTAPVVTTIYRISVSNPTSNCYAHFDQTITVVNDAVITQQPVGDTICINQPPVVLSVAATSSAPAHTYQWQRSTDGITFDSILSATSSSHMIPNTAASSLWYRVMISRPGAVCPPMFSDTVHVAVLAVPTVVSVTDSVRCGEGTVVLSATANPSTANIRWFSTSFSGDPLTTGNPSTGITGSGANWITPNITNTTTFYAEAHNGFCASAARTAVVATVLPPHVITHTGGDTNQTVCQGAAIDPIRFAFSGGATSGTITWSGQASNAPEGLNATADSIVGTVALTAALGVYNFTISTTPTGGTCPAITFEGSITVHSTPDTVTVTADPACGETVLTASGGTGGTIFWQNTTSNGTDATTASTSQTVTADGIYFFRARSAEGCWGVQGSDTVTIVQPHTLTLTSAEATANQVVIMDSAMTQITYARGGSATEVIITWTGTANATTPPAGIDVSSLTATPITISGRPTERGIFGFSIATVGTAICPASDTLTGTIDVRQAGCNNAEPGWGPGPLGASVASANTWTILGTGGRPTQIWSDAVVATACEDRTAFDGGTTGNFNADCRNSAGNNAFPGHYFSWCAVVRFADQLCPAPWRVPTRQDFIDLDLNLGGTGVNRSVSLQTPTGALTLGYMGTSAANSPQSRWGGSRFTGWTADPTPTLLSGYWSSTEQSATTAFLLDFSQSFVGPQFANNKALGYALRCVLPYECDQFHLTSEAGTLHQSICLGQEIVPITFELVEGTLGVADTTAIRWWSVSADGADTVSIAMPEGFLFNGVMHTIFSASITVAGNYIFEIFTVNHAATCDTARVRGTINVGLLPCPGCDNNPLTFELGTPYFATNQTWEVGTQVWSDAVRTPGCETAVFSNFGAACRNSGPNINFSGHMLNWCMVMRFADVLCPGGWRVPTTEDFEALHLNLGYAVVPAPGGSASMLPNTYLGTVSSPNGGIWGGAWFTGRLNSLGVFWLENSQYWSSTIGSTNNANSLFFSAFSVSPAREESIWSGMALRCVRNAEDPTTCDIIPLTSHDTTSNQTLCGTLTIADIVYNATGVTSAGISWFLVADNDTTQVAQPAGITFAIDPTTLTISGTFTETTTAVFIYQIHATTATTCLTASGRIARFTAEDCEFLALRCNINTPNWGDTLGTISWGTVANNNIESGTHIVHGTDGRPTQIWSGGVFAEACNKGTTANDAFNGGAGTPNFNADCRQTFFSVDNRSTSQTGDLFSWCAVVRFADELCPYPWRVPDMEDFAILHENLGHGPASINVSADLIPNTYIGVIPGWASAPQLGGIWGGIRYMGHAPNAIPGANATGYWSLSENTFMANRTHAFRLWLEQDAFNAWAWPQAAHLKSGGFGLRCVRDLELTTCDPLTLTSGSNGQSICGTDPITTITYNAAGVTSAAISWFIATPTDTTQILQPEGLTFDPITLAISGSITNAVPGTVFLYEIYARTATTCLTASGSITIFAAVTPGVIGGNQSICYGDTPAEFTNVTSASGGNPAIDVYQWQMSTDSITWGDISLANDPTFQAEALITTTHFRRMHLNDCGDTASNVITVTVNSLPPTPTIDSIIGNSDCTDTNPNGIIFMTGIAGMEYSIDSITFGTDSTFTGVAQGDHRVFIRNANGCISAVTVHVPAISGMPDLDGAMAVTPSSTICNPFGTGDIVISPTFTNAGTSPSFQWAIATATDTTDIATGQNLTLSGTDIPTATTVYRVTVTNNETGCEAHFYQTITVVDDAVITQQPVGDTICINQTSVVLSVTAMSSAPAHTYQWQSSTDGITFDSILGATSSSHTISNTAVSSLWYRVMISRPGAVCPPMFSDTVHVAVLAVPTVVSVTDSVRCGEGTVVLSAIANPSTTTIRWFSAEFGGDPLTTGTPNTGITASEENWITPNITETTTFWAEAHNGFCASAARTAVVAAMIEQTLSLTSAAPTANQSISLGAAIADITYAFGGLADSVSITWMASENTTAPPAGITVSDLTTNPITISGTPTYAGVYMFTITTIGDLCTSVSVTGSISADMSGCNLDTAGWVRPGFSDLGNITWGDVSNMDIEIGRTTVHGTGGRPSQVWSGAVFAAACDKTEFEGGLPGNFNADCRSANTNLTGHFFSWCAVMRFADLLCPDGWRVPTTEDFAILHQNLGFTLPAQGSSTAHDNTGVYIPTSGTVSDPNVGGIWGGARFTGHATNLLNAYSFYWSSTQSSGTAARHLVIDETRAWPQHDNDKNSGFALRCVRTYECDIILLTSEEGTLDQAVCNGDPILPIIFELDTNTLGTAQNLDVRWVRVSLDGEDTTAMANPPIGITVDLTAGTITGATVEWGYFIFEILATDPTNGCDTARVTGTIVVSSLSCPNCNSYIPGWGPYGLGTITWGNTTNTDIEEGTVTIDGTGGRSTQIWSSAVFATACAKGTNVSDIAYFDGGVFGSYSADCRQSLHTANEGRAAGITGDFFSWCAVVRFGDKLCPYPWRVPSREDFEVLHENLGLILPPSAGGMVEGGSTGTYTGPSPGSPALPTFGGIWQGARWTGSARPQGMDQTASTYWSSTFRSAEIGTQSHRLSFNNNSWPNGGSPRNHGYAVRCVRDSIMPPPKDGCNLNTPGWGNSLGTITWGSTSNTNIENGISVVIGTDGRPTQTWSGAVFATACNKGDEISGTEFDGGTEDNYNADCRQTRFSVTNRPTSPTGDFFSWCAVMRFADELCPAPWRVPTMEDFVALHQNLGFVVPPVGTGAPHNDTGYLSATEQVGGTWGGVRFSAHANNIGASRSLYWTSTERDDPSSAFSLLLIPDEAFPQAYHSKSSGFVLRCVRDTVLPVLSNGCNQDVPGWGPSLGTITWGSASNTNINSGTTTINGTGGRPTQTWSGAVFATVCAKGYDNNSYDEFDSGTEGNFSADCRQTRFSVTNRSTSPTGDFFSWCAVVRFADVLCPAPWRVPTMEDFVDLHQNLGFVVPPVGTGVPHNDTGYMSATGTTGNPEVGGRWGGVRFSARAGNIGASRSLYWTSTENSSSSASSLLLTSYDAYPQYNTSKSWGVTLRCVR